MSKVALLVFICLSALPSWAQHVLGPEARENSCLCTIRIVDPFGNTIDKADIRLQRESLPDIVLTQGAESTISHGTYSVAVTAEGFVSFKGTIVLTQRRQEWVICLQIPLMGDSGVAPRNAVFGKLIGDPKAASTCDSVLAFPVFCSTGSISTIHRLYKGGFGFDHLNSGLYTFVFLAGHKPCVERTVLVPFKPGQELLIEVPAK
jgi:hypothetical protein